MVVYYGVANKLIAPCPKCEAVKYEKCFIDRKQKGKVYREYLEYIHPERSKVNARIAKGLPLGS